MGNVLVHFSHQKMCDNIAAVCGAQEADIRRILIDGGLQWQIERGEITEEHFHQSFEQDLNKTIDIDALKHAAADIFWLNESIVPLLDELKALGIRLVLLSNTSITHLRFIQDRFDVLGRFDAFTTSFEAGALKPDDPIYIDALSKANCEPQSCFYTDDIEAYVLKARTFGINAEIYTETNKTRQALRMLGLEVACE
jgi:glucose-1-phosphatase